MTGDAAPFGRAAEADDRPGTEAILRRGHEDGAGLERFRERRDDGEVRMNTPVWLYVEVHRADPFGIRRDAPEASVLREPHCGLRRTPQVGDGFCGGRLDLARERGVNLRKEVNALDLFRARMLDGRLHSFIRNNPLLKRIAKKFFK